MRARLPLEVEEQLKKKCFTVLCYHNPSSGACWLCPVHGWPSGFLGCSFENNVLSFRFGTEAGKHWKCLLFCSLAGRIRVRNFVWIPFVWPVLSGSVLLPHGRMSSS